MGKIIESYKAVDTTDGDNVKLKRVFGYYQKEIFDPFLLLDHIDTSYPQVGFPWHPHRGIETITYLVKGKAFHEDSLGNKGEMVDGDIQWMQSGSGILHQEFPDKNSEQFEMLQFWLNMPKKNKMDNPKYYYTNVLDSNIVIKGKSKISVIAGNFEKIEGPIQKQDRNIRMLYIDLNDGDSLSINRVVGTNAFIYVLKGNGKIDSESIEEFNIYKLDEGEIVITAISKMKMIFAEGNPLNENIEWYGPIVMNSKEEIDQARKELADGSFIKNMIGENI